jgi:hypothetical protein
MSFRRTATCSFSESRHLVSKRLAFEAVPALSEGRKAAAGAPLPCRTLRRPLSVGSRGRYGQGVSGSLSTSPSLGEVPRLVR